MGYILVREAPLGPRERPMVPGKWRLCGVWRVGGWIASTASGVCYSFSSVIKIVTLLASSFKCDAASSS